MKILVVFNPASHKALKWPDVVSLVREKIEQKPHTELVWIDTESAGQIEEVARSAVAEGFDIIVGMGVDGTVNELVNATCCTGQTVGIIPFGITNVFALEAGIPLDPIDAVDVLFDGKKQRFDLGDANGRKFMLMLGAGLDAQAVHLYKPELKKYLNQYAYIASGVKAFFTYKQTPLSVTVMDNGEELIGYQVIVANCGYYGGKRKIAPDAVPTDGYLNLVVYKRRGIFPTFKYFVTTVIAQHHRLSDIEFRRVKSVKIDGDAPYHIDSEPIGHLPVDVFVVVRAVEIMVPER